MRHCSSGILLTLAVTFLFALSGCLGKSSSNTGNGGVISVTLNPGGTTSLDVGASEGFAATGRNSLGQTVLGLDIRFVVQSGNPNTSAPLSIASNGNACAGTWDVNIAICSPGTPGIALVTAVINGISSPVTTVYVHQHVDSIQITNAEAQPPLYECFSQGQTWHYSAVALSKNVDITTSVGPMTWSSSNTGVVTTTPIVAGTSQNPVFQVETTAKAPGITQLFASVSGTTSNPFPYTTCLIQAIYLQIGGQSQAGNSIAVNGGGTVSIKAIAIDTLFNVASGTPLANPPLTWSTTNPEVAAFSTITNDTGSNTATARNNLGGATLTASCTPPSCNIGVLPSLPIFASDCNATDVPAPCPLPGGTKGFGAISVDVTLSATSKPSVYTAWSATTECENLPGCSSALFSVTSGNTPIGTIVGLPRTPNSMVFNHLAAARLYLGSDQGLMFVDVSGSNPTVSVVSNSPTPCKLALCGKVLTISNDGSRVVIADNVSTPSQVYIFNASGGNAAPVDLIIPGETPTAAAFSPDQLKLFILTSTGKMYVYSTSDAFTSVPIATSVTDVKFSADGSFAYVAGAPASSVSAFSSCSLPSIATVDIGSVAASSTPLEIFPLPVAQPDPLGLTQKIIALEPPNIEILTADEFTQALIPYQTPLQLTCDPPTLQSFSKGPSYNLGKGNFVPIYAQLVADGTEVILVAQKIPAVLLFDVGSGNTTAVPLANSADPLAASASSDGSQVFVAACDQYDPNDPNTCAVGSIHIINNSSQTGLPLGDFQQVPYVDASTNNSRNMCNNGGNPVPQCLPNMVAIKPQ